MSPSAFSADGDSTFFGDSEAVNSARVEKARPQAPAVPVKAAPAKPTARKTCHGALNAAECEIFELTNVERTRRKLNPLRLDSSCIAAAKENSATMASLSNKGRPLRVSIDHHDFEGRNNRHRLNGGSTRSIAENVAGGTYRNSGEVISGWMESSGHRTNMLNPNMTHFGVGLAQDNRGQSFWTQCFVQKAQ